MWSSMWTRSLRSKQNAETLKVDEVNRAVAASEVLEGMYSQVLVYAVSS